MAVAYNIDKIKNSLIPGVESAERYANEASNTVSSFVVPTGFTYYNLLKSYVPQTTSMIKKDLNNIKTTLENLVQEINKLERSISNSWTPSSWTDIFVHPFKYFNYAVNFNAELKAQNDAMIANTTMAKICAAFEGIAKGGEHILDALAWWNAAKDEGYSINDARN